MFYHNINPVILDLGFAEIRWYGVIFAIGFLLTYFFLTYYAKNRKIHNFKESDVIDFLIVAVISVIVGSRLFEILFYNLAYYLQNPLQMLMFWKGGLSFHGGLVGLVIGAYFFCKKKKVRLLQLGDYVIIPVALGLSLGRFANFINSELYGTRTNLPWCVNFKNAEGCRHPSQIYESFKNLAIFFVLFFTERKKKPREGTIFFLFLILYGTIRFLIEFVKDLPVVFLGLKMGQVFCLFMVITGLVFLIKKK